MHNTILYLFIQSILNRGIRRTRFKQASSTLRSSNTITEIDISHKNEQKTKRTFTWSNICACHTGKPVDNEDAGKLEGAGEKH